MPNLWARVRKGLPAAAALEATEAWMPWGHLFQKWQALGQIELAETKQKQPSFSVEFGTRERTFSAKSFDVDKFRGLVEMKTATDFTFHSHPDDSSDKRANHVGFLSDTTCPLSLRLAEITVGEIPNDLAEDIWETALRWLQLPGVLFLYGACPNVRPLFGDMMQLESPQLFAYSWTVYLRPDVLKLLGGIDFVVGEAPVERHQVIETFENKRGLLCRIGVSPHMVSDDQWRAWRNFLSPALGEMTSGFYPGEQFPRLTPEDQALFPGCKHLYEHPQE
jgi:hypothetical protein